LSKLILILAALVLPYIAWTALGEAPAAVTGPAVRPVAAPTADADATLPGAVPVAPLPPVEQFNAMVERPLFSPSRRPALVEAAPVPDAPEPDEPPPPPGTPDFRLVGTVIRGGEMTALILDPDQPDLVPVTEGDSVGEWQVLQIEKNRVVLQRDQDQIVLTMLE
jgi:general secretion pathway protein N